MSNKSKEQLKELDENPTLKNIFEFLVVKKKVMKLKDFFSPKEEQI